MGVGFAPSPVRGDNPMGGIPKTIDATVPRVGKPWRCWIEKSSTKASIEWNAYDSFESDELATAGSR